MKKIAIITPMLQPYRISFYEKLAFYDPEFQWEVYHGVSANEDGRPNFKGETKFIEKGFREHKFNIGPFRILYNKGMFSELRRYNPDIIILQGIAGDLTNRRIISWAKRKKKKTILWTCGWESGLAKGVLLKFKRFLISVFFEKANLHLTYSSKANLYTQAMGIKPEIIRTCYNGIEIDDLLSKEAEVLQKSKDIISKYELKNHITFLYVGGLIPEKRIDLLLNAFSALRQKHDKIKLLIIGDGPLKNQVSKMVSELDDKNIYYLGRIIDGVDPYFAASDCLVLPGAGGLALNQAMFWRKTCIVSEADGTEDDLVIEMETGFRFEKNNLESLKDAMERRICTSPDLVDKMSQSARNIIDTKSNVNNMVEVFMSGVKELS